MSLSYYTQNKTVNPSEYFLNKLKIIYNQNINQIKSFLLPVIQKLIVFYGLLFVLRSFLKSFLAFVEFIVGLLFGCDLSSFTNRNLFSLHCSQPTSGTKLFLEKFTFFGYQIVDVSLGTFFRTLLQPALVWWIFSILIIWSLYKKVSQKKWVRVLPVIPLTFGVIIILLNLDANGGQRIREYQEFNRQLFPANAPTKAPQPTPTPPIFKPFIVISEPKYPVGISLINRNVWGNSDPMKTEKDGVTTYTIDSLGATVSLGKLLDKNKRPTTAQMYFRQMKQDIVAKKYKVYQEESLIVDGQWSRYILYEVGDSADDCQQIVSIPQYRNQFVAIWGQGSVCKEISHQLHFSQIYDNVRLQVSLESSHGNNIYLIQGQIRKERLDPWRLKVTVYDKANRIKFSGTAQITTSAKWINDPEFVYFEISVPYDLISNAKWITVEGVNPREIWKFDESAALLFD